MNILFVCTGNTCRSPMAEGILKTLAQTIDKDIVVESAGIFALEGGKISENSIIALKDIGIDISKKKSKLVSKKLVDEADLILTMSKSHLDNMKYLYPHIEGKIFMLNEYSYGIAKDIEDPFGGDLERYQMIRDKIYDSIDNMIRTKEDFK